MLIIHYINCTFLRKLHPFSLQFVMFAYLQLMTTKLLLYIYYYIYNFDRLKIINFAISVLLSFRHALCISSSSTSFTHGQANKRNTREAMNISLSGPEERVAPRNSLAPLFC